MCIVVWPSIYYCSGKVGIGNCGGFGISRRVLLNNDFLHMLVENIRIQKLIAVSGKAHFFIETTRMALSIEVNFILEICYIHDR